MAERRTAALFLFFDSNLKILTRCCKSLDIYTESCKM